MNIIIDTNVLLSALIKDSITRKIILEGQFLFWYPQAVFDELKRNQTIDPFLAQAFELAHATDPNDWLFFACALACPDSLLWANDKKLHQQPIVKMVTTGKMNQFLLKQKELNEKE